MNRQQERALLAILGLVLVGLVMVAGSRVLSGGGQSDLATDGETVAVLPEVETEESVEPTELLPQDNGAASPSTVNPTTSTTELPSTSLAQPTDTVAATAAPTTSTTSASSSVSSTTTTETSTTATTKATSSSVESTSTTEADDNDDDTTTTADTSDDETTSTTADVTTTTEEATTTTTEVSNELSGLEREIVRLTNALRADPDGDLRRLAPMPECVADEVFAITVDAETEHPVPVPALTENRAVSLQMARDWSQQMASADEMSHRSQDSQRAIYTALGIERTAFGENVAWAQGFPESSVAMEFFTGWRESDSGHYCSMLSSRFTHVGVGHYRTESDKDWGTQNFYSAP